VEPSQSPVEGQRVGKGFRASVIRVEIFAAINDRDEQEIICQPKVEKIEPIAQ
jgi:hypothetical protein